MRLLLSGATGYVGRYLLKKLNRDKFHLALLVRKEYSEEHPGDLIIDIRQNNWKEKVRNFDPDTVIHLAAYLTSDDDEKQIDRLIESNISFGTHLLDALRLTNIKTFVNTGTIKEYHLHEGKKIPSYLYAATKSAFRPIIDYYQSLIGFRYFNIIPYTIYGGVDSEKKMLDLIYESLGSVKPIDMSPGEQVMDFIHIDDVVNFYITLLLQLPGIKNEISEIHLGYGKGSTPKQIAALMEKISEEKCNINWGGRPYRPNDTMYSVAPQNLSGLQIGWQPTVSIDDGIALYIKERKKHGV
jgi:nucleoside-diphosphate-sugar epimerase